MASRLADRQRQLLFTERDTLLGRSAAIVDEHPGLVAALRDDDPFRFAALLQVHLTSMRGPVLGPV